MSCVFLNKESKMFSLNSRYFLLDEEAFILFKGKNGRDCLNSRRYSSPNRGWRHSGFPELRLE